MSRWVLVETVSQHRMRYCVEFPDDIRSPEGEGVYPTTPKAYASDTVVCEQAKEFSQDYMGEVIVSSREITEEDAIELFKEDNDYLSHLDDERIKEIAFTEIGHNEAERIEQECKGLLL